MSGKNTTYYRFAQKQRFYERKPKNGHFDEMDKSQVQVHELHKQHGEYSNNQWEMLQAQSHTIVN